MFEGSPIYTIRISSHPGPQIKTLPHKNMPPPNQNKQLNVNHSIFFVYLLLFIILLIFHFSERATESNFQLWWPCGFWGILPSLQQWWGGMARSLQANRVNRCQSHFLDRDIPVLGMFIYVLTFFSTLKNYENLSQLTGHMRTWNRAGLVL